MGTVVAVEYSSLDGIMEEPAWSGPYFNEEVADFQYDNLFSSDALLLGRVTYEGFKAAWPSMTGDKKGFGLRMNALPKFVATATLDQGEWNATLLKGDPVESVAQLKKDFDGTLLINGSARLFGALHGAGLIDEYRIMVYPVLVGGGKRLFPDGATGALDLVKAQITKSGVAILTYRPAARTSTAAVA
jgi:dihydrofolate reductase